MASLTALTHPATRSQYVDLPRIFTIRESRHRIHNPFDEPKLDLLGG